MERQMIGIVALAILVVGVVVYRVIWFLERERRRGSGIRWFKPRE